MKNVIFFLFFICQMAQAQTPVLSLDAGKGFGGTTWQDQSGNNNTISISSNTSKTADGVYFDGSTSANLSTPIPLSNFTIYMTVKMEAMDRTLLGNGKDSDYGFHYQANALYTAIEQPYSSFNSTAITTNKQVVVTLTRNVEVNGGNIIVFINGNKVGVFPKRSQSVFNLTNLAGEVGYFFKGWIKNLTVYNVAHTASKVKTLATDFAIFKKESDAKDVIPIVYEGTLNGMINIQSDLMTKPIRDVNTVFTVQCYLVDSKGTIGRVLDTKVTFTNPYVAGERTFLPCTIEKLPLNRNFIIVLTRVIVQMDLLSVSGRALQMEWKMPSGFTWKTTGKYYLDATPAKAHVEIFWKLTTRNPRETPDFMLGKMEIIR